MFETFIHINIYTNEIVYMSNSFIWKIYLILNMLIRNNVNWQICHNKIMSYSN